MNTSRVQVSTRRIVVESYARSDGLFDIEGHVQDVPENAVIIGTRVSPAGKPLHDMRIRITIDQTLMILEAQAWTEASPYPGVCDTIVPEYGRLAGVRMEAGFRGAVARLFAGTRGCTHITELIGNLATVAFQTITVGGHGIAVGKPRQIDGCHALSSDGAVVAEFYPEWHRSPSGTV